MGNADDKHDGRDTTPRRGDQTQGGISREVTERARQEHDPEAGVPNGPQGGEPVEVPAKQVPREDGDEDEGGQVPAPPVDPDSESPDAGVDESYQSGGTREDMAQQVRERKLQEPGGGASNSTGAADPAPGSQPGRERTPADRS